MTDGIIQELFKKYHTNEICIDGEELQELEQELIEKIKQDLVNGNTNIQKEYKISSPNFCAGFNNATNSILTRLIGDNQE